VPALPEIRRAVLGDVSVLARSLSRAFRDDAVSAYLFPDEKRRQANLETFFRLQLERTYLPKGEVYTTGDRRAAAMWMPPDSKQPGLLVQLAYVRMALSTHSFRRGRELALQLYRLRPKERHYYLGTIGTDPNHQGRGLGSALLRPVLARLDEAGMPAYLESSSEKNVRFYQGHGFAVRGNTRVGTSGPELWLMWREALSA
jgi:ribosomal protein S18 acetylase RimI-like enzyme